MKIGSRIRTARKAAELSQEELARRADMSLNGFADIERGHIRDPHYSSLKKIADGLGIPVGALLGEPALAGKAEAPGEAGPTTEESEGERLLKKLIRRVIADLEADAERWGAFDGEVSSAVYREIVGRRVSIQSSLGALDDVAEALDVNISDRQSSPLRRVQREVHSAFNYWNAARSALVDRHFDAVLRPEQAEEAEQEEIEVEAAEGDARPVTVLAEWQAERQAGTNMHSPLLHGVS